MEMKDFATSVEDVMEAEQFAIHDDGAAEWAIKKVAEERAECDRLVKAAQDQISYYQAVIENIKERSENKTRFLIGKLHEYFGEISPRETKTQLSYKLPSGSLVYTKPKLDFERDDEALMKFLMDSKLDDYVKVEAKPKWAEIKKQLDVVDGTVIFAETGEPVDSITAIEKPASFDVKL